MLSDHPDLVMDGAARTSKVLGSATNLVERVGAE